ncbi:hypothetical protein F5Y10DRAFT_54683 [Nemania abortiva]|nr:hypothetical protein F5Y10DRAFT_54683 [Nemania abortiva]
MSERSHSSTPTLKEREWAPLRHQYYPPPRDISQYVNRPLPQLPTPTAPVSQSRSPSTYESEGDCNRQKTPDHPLIADEANNGHKSTAFSGAIDEKALAMVQRPQIVIPNHPQPNDHPHVVSPQPQRPDSTVISTWVNGDELVSPLYTPGTESWKTHVVSPLSNNSVRGPSSETGPASADYESWFDDTSSDEEEGERPDSSDGTLKKNQFAGSPFSGASNMHLGKMSLPYSDPVTPVSASPDAGGFGEPGPDVGRSREFGDLSGRQTVQPQVYIQPTQSPDGQNNPRDIDESIGEIKISFAMPEIATFSSHRPGASQRPVPPPLNLGDQQPVQEGYVKTPFPPRADSASSQRSAFKSDEPSVEQQQKPRSVLSSFGTPRRSSIRHSPKPPPGFTEVFSQIDSQGVISPVKNMLSKARQGLGISSDESRKERRRDEIKRQIRHQNEA